MSMLMLMLLLINDCDDVILLGQHWAELMAKQMPESEAYGPSQVKIVTMTMNIRIIITR